jgi:subfamily B ATP-binding cassette protein MsbA
MRKTSYRSQERMADLSALLTEGVRGNRVVKAFGMEEFEAARFRHATARHLRVNLRAQLISAASGPVVESISGIGAAALFVYAGTMIRRAEFSSELFLTFLTSLMLLYDPIRKLNKVNLVLQEALAAGHRVRDLMSTPNEIVDQPTSPPLPGLSDSICFEDVSFAYGNKRVLEDFSLQLASGEVVALVGPSGAGKSTVVNLLPRFFDPDRGRITIDDIDIRTLPLQNLRSLIGVVTQDTVLFNDSVRNNIAYGRAELSLERVREAAAAAYADEFIMELEHGYDTVIGEGGSQLSGGQRQRLAIARALLKNAPVLILDEATSHLDTESEVLVQRAIYNLMEGRTALVIAHRLSTVTRADRILVLDQGRIVEQGSHQELLARDGAYKRLYDLQFP